MSFCPADLLPRCGDSVELSLMGCSYAGTFYDSVSLSKQVLDGNANVGEGPMHCSAKLLQSFPTLRDSRVSEVMDEVRGIQLGHDCVISLILELLHEAHHNGLVLLDQGIHASRLIPFLFYHLVKYLLFLGRFIRSSEAVQVVEGNHPILGNAPPLSSCPGRILA